MSFDGINYRDADWVYPPGHHPKNALAPDVLQGSLLAAYFDARNHARVVFQQSYGWNQRDPAGQLGFTVFISATDWTKVAEGYAYLEDEISHLVAHVVFAAAPTEASTAHHRVRVTDGTATADGADVTTDVLAVPAALPNIAHGSDAAALYHVQCRVALASLTLPATCRAWVEGYVEAGPTTPVIYRPGHVSCWWEVIG